MAGIGTGWLIAGLAVQLGGAAFSFNRGNRQRREARSATNQAQAAMDKARKRTDMNKFGKLAINKDIYKDQRDSVTAASAQVTQAAVEGDPRGVGATAGKITAQAQNMQRQITVAQSQEAQKLEMIKAQEDARLADERMRIDMGEANQMFGTANALNTMAADSTAQGVKGLANAAQMGIKQGMSGVGGGRAGREFGRLGKAADLDGTSDLDNARLALLAAQEEGGIGYDRFSKMDRGQEFNDFMDDLRQGRGTTDFSSDWFKSKATKFYSADDFNYLREEYKKLGMRY